MKEKILIVDDIAVNREILASMLEGFYQIIEVSDGGQAIDILKSENDGIALVLLDLIMPKVDGFAVLQFMKDAGIFARVPVIVISADSDAKTERECLKLGASDFIRKPFDNMTVKNRVKNLAELFVYKNKLEDLVKVQTEGLDRQNKLLEQQSNRIKAVNEKVILRFWVLSLNIAILKAEIILSALKVLPGFLQRKFLKNILNTI